MTKFQTALASLSLLLMVGASTLPAPAQTQSATGAGCSIQAAPAHALTQYPAEWPTQMAGYNPTGTAIVRFTLTEDGTPQDATIVKSTGDYRLDQSAKAAVLSQKFSPEIRNCQEVAGSYLYEVDYDNN